jgi:ADP-ribosylglycohydrolase
LLEGLSVGDAIGERFFVAPDMVEGTRVSAQDTVPFALWCAAHHLDDYEEALWTTVRGLGDRDTTCAIVGGVVVLATGVAAIPAEWRWCREPLS